ncbi:unnamed protein product, partial [Rodentolepis nana]|uniref:ER membrane protein complex subunit 1 n=1 Tax=Rodentolepis nana TaxID=102285 RepID=A0A0R3T096_RODNA
DLLLHFFPFSFNFHFFLFSTSFSTTFFFLLLLLLFSFLPSSSLAATAFAPSAFTMLVEFSDCAEPVPMGSSLVARNLPAPILQEQARRVIIEEIAGEEGISYGSTFYILTEYLSLNMLTVVILDFTTLQEHQLIQRAEHSLTTLSKIFFISGPSVTETTLPTPIHPILSLFSIKSDEGVDQSDDMTSKL